MRGLMEDAEAPSVQCARDFIHLSQRLHTREGALLHDVASILQKCLKYPAYQERALSNLSALAETNETLKTILEAIQQEGDELNDIKPLAQQALSQTEDSPTAKL